MKSTKTKPKLKKFQIKNGPIKGQKWEMTIGGQIKAEMGNDFRQGGLHAFYFGFWLAHIWGFAYCGPFPVVSPALWE